MMRRLTGRVLLVGCVSLAILGGGAASAGELVLANGSRLEAQLPAGLLLVATEAGLVDVAPEAVVLLTPSEILLVDGRVVRGTLVGGHLRARTSLGELAVRVEELESYRSGAPAARVGAGALGAPGRVPGGRSGDPGPAPVSTGVVAPWPVDVPAGAELSRYRVSEGEGVGAGLALSQPPQPPAPAALPEGEARRSGTVLADPGVGSRAGRRLEVIAEATLYRDAFAAASRVGRVVRGQLVVVVDFIDRRLRILDTLIFDGGYWLKVRASDGTEGWLPAATVRELR
jgi:hypothetical protein